MADNNTEIKIRAKKISQLEKSNLSLYEHGDKLYLLISYKPNNSENGQNFRLSVNDIIDEIIENISIPGSTIANEIIEYLSENTTNSNTFLTLLKRYLNSESAWQTAQRLGKTGGAQTEESWYDLIISGTGGTPTEPEEPEVISVSSVSISGSTAALTVGSTRNLSAVITPSNATNKNVVWTSSNSSIATVNSSGKVTAVSPGQVTITVKTDDGAHTNSVNIQIESATPADVHQYIFSYASENQSGIFTKTNNVITGVNITAVKALSWTQETTGIVPTNNKNGHGFYMKDYSTTYEESFVWDDAVMTGRVWIILPAKFYNISQKSFIDENNGKWRYVDALMKNPLNPAVDPITITGLYEGQDYVLVCFAEEGQRDEQYFKKIG